MGKMKKTEPQRRGDAEKLLGLTCFPLRLRVSAVKEYVIGGSDV
jgi:hypothetical protein